MANKKTLTAELLPYHTVRYELFTEDDILTRNGHRLILAEDLHQEILMLAHESYPHCQNEKTATSHVLVAWNGPSN